MLIILNGLHPGELSIFTKDASCGQKLRELVQVAACRPLILSMLSKLQPSDLDDHERWRRILLSIEDRHAGINVLIRVITKGRGRELAKILLLVPAENIWLPSLKSGL